MDFRDEPSSNAIVYIFAPVNAYSAITSTVAGTVKAEVDDPLQKRTSFLPSKV